MSITLSKDEILSCCHSEYFANALLAYCPFSNEQSLISTAHRIWWQETPISAWLESFAAHPKIGDINALRTKYGAFADMSKQEQSTAASASDATLADLAHWNTEYQAKFEHIFIIKAADKSADDMLDAIKTRYNNTPLTELSNTAEEQFKITQLRLLNILSAKKEGGSTATKRAGQILLHIVADDKTHSSLPTSDASPSLKSPITTHVLDTAVGRPASDVPVSLAMCISPSSSTSTSLLDAVWSTIATGVTNTNGRVDSLLPGGRAMEAGVYRLTFHVAPYMKRCKAAHPGFFADRPFYPLVTVYFEVGSDQVGDHFHVPLTWNPYGYSTYRGS